MKMKESFLKFLKKSPKTQELIVSIGGMSPFNDIGRVMFKNKCKTLNSIKALKSMKRSVKKPRNFPIYLVMALSNSCNYSCPICSINSLKNEGYKCAKTQINFEEIQKFSRIFKYAQNVRFMGNIGESITNPDFNKIVCWIKDKHKVSTFVSTNGMAVDEEMSKVLVNKKFNSMHFSIHAATKETYQKLQGGSFRVVMENLERLCAEKKKNNSKAPYLVIVYGINELNIDESFKMVDIAAKLKIDALNFFHYHDYCWNDIVIKDEKEANRKLKKLENYAKRKGVLLQNGVPYFGKVHACGNNKCFLPWAGFQMRSSFSKKDSFYVGCCNYVDLFLFNYKKHLQKNEEFDFKKLWHHELLQYLRATVNSKKGNPICNFCKSKEKDLMRSGDGNKYTATKSKAKKEFFEGFIKNYGKLEDKDDYKILWDSRGEI